MTADATVARLAPEPTVRDLLIVGLDVHSGEMAEIVERINIRRPTWRLRGFVSLDGARAGETFVDYPVYAAQALQEWPDAALVPGFDPASRSLPKERYATLIDPSAWVSRTARIGTGCVVYPHCFVGLHARLGDFVLALSGSVVNHDDVLGDRVVVASGVRLAGQVVVEDDCYLGQACTIRQFTRVGRGSLIGTGAVVLRHVDADSVMVGNPARLLRRRSQQ
jgi:sugar O-acyltransferase (sialic acid O-acetyltransferase NeuD family)